MSKKALLLTRNRFLYASRRLTEEAKSRGCSLACIDPSALRIDGNFGLEKPEVALLRFASQSRDDSLLSASLLEAQGVEVINSSDSARIASSKLSSQSALMAASIPCVDSTLLRRGMNFEEAAESLGGFPIIAKREFGTKGEGVFLFESLRSARSILPFLLSHGPLLLQRFVAEAEGADVRYLVLDGAILAGASRQGSAGDFRANFHRGATMMPYMDEEGAEIALGAAKALGLRFAGIDLIETQAGWRVLEANASAGFRGVEEACGVSVAGAIIDHFLA